MTTPPPSGSGGSSGRRRTRPAKQRPTSSAPADRAPNPGEATQAISTEDLPTTVLGVVTPPVPPVSTPPPAPRPADVICYTEIAIEEVHNLVEEQSQRGYVPTQITPWRRYPWTRQQFTVIFSR